MVAGLVHQRERRIDFAAQQAGGIEGADAEVADALVADEEERRAFGGEEEEGFFKAGVEAGGPEEVGVVFAVAVDEQMGVAEGAGQSVSRRVWVQVMGDR
jgi:hypothetical protein